MQTGKNTQHNTATITRDARTPTGADFPVSRGHALTALAFADDGLNVCVGTHSGHVLQYDLRSSRPLLHKRHQYELPVHSLAYHKCVAFRVFLILILVLILILIRIRILILIRILVLILIRILILILILIFYSYSSSYYCYGY